MWLLVVSQNFAWYRSAGVTFSGLNMHNMLQRIISQLSTTYLSISIERNNWLHVHVQFESQADDRSNLCASGQFGRTPTPLQPRFTHHWPMGTT